MAVLGKNHPLREDFWILILRFNIEDTDWHFFPNLTPICAVTFTVGPTCYKTPTFSLLCAPLAQGAKILTCEIWVRPTYACKILSGPVKVYRSYSRKADFEQYILRSQRTTIMEHSFARLCTREVKKTTNTFCETWYLPHSWVHYDRQCHFSMRMCETALLLLPVWDLTVGTIKMINLRHRAKFRGDQSNRCGDMAIFRFFQDGGCPLSWICDAHV